jgi:tRNA C32,U32 (ribose-2'-O)-methylase TrmJ|tara:strand:+ start:188 stop:502 length:315 start_codon:yes stop_codon:yes gene_type:complete
MESEVMQVIMNGGSNVAFAAFLYWQYMEQRKRGDAREKRAEEREDALRARYDKVIADLQAREDKIREDIVKEISDLDKRMSLLEQKLESMNTLIEQIKARVFKA